MTDHASPASTIDPSITIDEAIRRDPSAIAVFNALGIDACCGGGRSLDDAAREDGIDLAALLEDLGASRATAVGA